MIVSKLKNKFKNRRKHKVVFRLHLTGKKICTVKFNDEEMNKINLAVKISNITIEEFFADVLKNAAKGANREISGNR